MFDFKVHGMYGEGEERYKKTREKKGARLEFRISVSATRQWEGERPALPIPIPTLIALLLLLVLLQLPTVK